MKNDTAVKSKIAKDKKNPTTHSRPLLRPPLRQNRRGAAIVEFAFVAPVFFLIVFGFLQFSIFLFARSEMHALAYRVSHICAIDAGERNSTCTRENIRVSLNAHRPNILNTNRPPRWEFTTADITPCQSSSTTTNPCGMRPSELEHSQTFQVRFDWNFMPSLLTGALRQNKAKNLPGTTDAQKAAKAGARNGLDWSMPILVFIIVTPQNI